MSDRSENVGEGIEAKNARWTFGGNVCKQFDEHVSRSVPLYSEGHNHILELSDFFATEGSRIYDLGCSTGTLSSSIAKRHSDKMVQVVAIDSEEQMIREAKAKFGDLDNCSFQVADLRNAQLQACDLVIIYYSMQFIQPKFRQDIFDRVYSALNWGGALMLFEKVRAPDARFQDIVTQLYTEFKISQGFTSDEIIAKSRSLKGILDPFTSAANIEFLERAGFVDICVTMKFLCFEGFLAIK
jgi:tRNA (cmo5U34)-methyltransferase